jgi:hypothetical protein
MWARGSRADSISRAVLTPQQSPLDLHRDAANNQPTLAHCSQPHMPGCTTPTRSTTGGCGVGLASGTRPPTMHKQLLSTMERRTTHDAALSGKTHKKILRMLAFCRAAAATSTARGLRWASTKVSEPLQ